MSRRLRKLNVTLKRNILRMLTVEDNHRVLGGQFFYTHKTGVCNIFIINQI